MTGQIIKLDGGISSLKAWT